MGPGGAGRDPAASEADGDVSPIPLPVGQSMVYRNVVQRQLAPPLRPKSVGASVRFGLARKGPQLEAVFIFYTILDCIHDFWRFVASRQPHDVGWMASEHKSTNS